MWIFAFARWTAHFLTKPCDIEEELERLSADARVVALVRPVIDWQSDRGAEPAALTKFIEEVGSI